MTVGLHHCSSRSFFRSTHLSSLLWQTLFDFHSLITFPPYKPFLPSSIILKSFMTDRKCNIQYRGQYIPVCHSSVMDSDRNVCVNQLYVFVCVCGVGVFTLDILMVTYMLTHSLSTGRNRHAATHLQAVYLYKSMCKSCICTLAV